MILHPFKALGAFFTALGLLFSPALRLFVLAPLLANFVLMAALYLFALSFLSGLTDTMMSWLPSWLSFLDWLFYLLFSAIGLVILFYSFSLGVNILASPFMGILAEKVEQQRTGKTLSEDLSLALVMTLIGQSILRECQKLAYFLPRIGLLLLLSFIPVVNIVTPILWLLFSCWMLAIQYMDYAFDNNKVSFSMMRAICRKTPILCWSFGAILLLLLMIPLVNLFVMPLAVVAATCLWVDVFKVEHGALVAANS